MVECVIPNPLHCNESLVMPRSDRQSPHQSHTIRVRKSTPMVMPQPGRLLSPQTAQSISEDDELVEADQPDLVDLTDTTSSLLNNEDGTFVIPKLNKVELGGPKQEFKTKPIIVDLKHHLFESKPLETSDEPSSQVILGRPMAITSFNDENEIKKRRKKMFKSTKDKTLALVDEIIPEVDLCYMFYCSMFSLIVLSFFSFIIIFIVIICLWYSLSNIRKCFSSNFIFMIGNQRGTQRCKT